ncbi:MAG: hypothetical protein ABI418_07825, partial [Jatrophihabitantaceae bacterium]
AVGSGSSRPLARHQVSAALAAAMRRPAGNDPTPPPPGSPPTGPQPTGRQSTGPQSLPAIPISALHRRRTGRAFSRQPLPVDTLIRAVRAGQQLEAALWDGSALEPVLLADRVDGHRPGLLRLAGGELAWAGPLPAAWSELVLQPDLATAAAVLVWIGEPGPAGAPGYRQLLVRAGAAAIGSLLQAGEDGATGCLFDGLLPAGRSAATGHRPGALALFAVALGLPVDSERRDPAATENRELG